MFFTFLSMSICSFLKCRPLIPLQHFTHQLSTSTHFTNMQFDCCFLLWFILHSQYKMCNICVIKYVTPDSQTENIHILMRRVLWIK